MPARLKLALIAARLCALTAVPSGPAQAMVYQPAKVGMGDQWLYYHNGVHYLYHLDEQPAGQLHGVYLATSTDGVHFKEIGPVIEKQKDAQWLGSGSVWLAPLKSAEIGAQGHLRLAYWRGNDAMKGEAVSLAAASGPLSVDGTKVLAAAPLPDAFDVDDGLVLEGTLEIQPSAEKSGHCGVYLEETAGQATAVMLGTDGQTRLGTLKLEGEKSFAPDDSVPIGIAPGRRHAFRLLARRYMLEFYLENRLIQCYRLPERATGRIGFVAQGGLVPVESLKAWRMTFSSGEDLPKGAGAAAGAAKPAVPACDTPTMPANPPPTWLTYHLAHPGDTLPGDPNCIFFWKGRYHLHYIYENKAGVSYAHVSSTDMLHWKWHPATLSPATMGHSMFSGAGFLTKEGKPAIIYHGQESGRNQIAFAEDDLLEKWSKPVVVEPKTKTGQLPQMRHWDPDCWLDGATYYAVSGGRDPHLMKSADLKNWEYLGRLLHENMPNVGVPRDEDISCPNMFRIGNKWMLLCLSHWLGCRYYLGHFQDEKFVPESHGLMNWMCAFNQGHEDADVFAPESLLTPDGRRVMWAWSRVRQRLKGVPVQSSIQCLPRELGLPEDGILRIKPLRELGTLRYDEKSEANLTVKGDSAYRLKEIAGDTLEIKLVFQPGAARQFGVHVYCGKQGGGGFPIAFEPEKKVLTLGETRVPLGLKPGEDLELRVFLDKSIIEVFVNDRQAALSPHKYAPEDLAVSLFSKGGDVLVKEVKGWKMRSIYAGASTHAP